MRDPRIIPFDDSDELIDPDRPAPPAAADLIGEPSEMEDDPFRPKEAEDFLNRKVASWEYVDKSLKEIVDELKEATGFENIYLDRMNIDNFGIDYEAPSINSTGTDKTVREMLVTVTAQIELEVVVLDNKIIITVPEDARDKPLEEVIEDIGDDAFDSSPFGSDPDTDPFGPPEADPFANPFDDDMEGPPEAAEEEQDDPFANPGGGGFF